MLSHALPATLPLVTTSSDTEARPSPIALCGRLMTIPKRVRSGDALNYLTLFGLKLCLVRKRLNALSENVSAGPEGVWSRGRLRGWWSAPPRRSSPGCRLEQAGDVRALVIDPCARSPAKCTGAAGGNAPSRRSTNASAPSSTWRSTPCDIAGTEAFYKSFPSRHSAAAVKTQFHPNLAQVEPRRGEARCSVVLSGRKCGAGIAGELADLVQAGTEPRGGKLDDLLAELDEIGIGERRGHGMWAKHSPRKPPARPTGRVCPSGKTDQAGCDEIGGAG